MSLLVSNNTGSPITISGTSKIISASTSPPALSEPTDVTSELRPNLTVDPVRGHSGGLTAANYTAINAQTGLVFKWTGTPEYATTNLVIGGAHTTLNLPDLATGGTGTISNPWTGWDTALNALTQYDIFAPAGYYQINTRVNVPLYSNIRGAGYTTQFTTATGYIGGAFRLAGVINGSTGGYNNLENFRVVNGDPYVNTRSVGVEVTATSFVTIKRLFIHFFWCNSASDQGEINHWSECDFAMSPYAPAGLPARYVGIVPQGTPGTNNYTVQVVAKYAGGLAFACGAAVSTGPATVNGTDFLRTTWTAPVSGTPTGYDIYVKKETGTLPDSPNWTVIGKVGSVGAGVLTFDYTGQAGNGGHANESIRNFWIVAGGGLNPTARPGFSNVTNINRCNFNASYYGIHFVHDGGNSCNIEQNQFNAGDITIRAAGAIPVTIADNYAEGMQTRFLVMNYQNYDDGLGAGGCSVDLHGNVVSNGPNASVSVEGNGNLNAIGNQFFGNAVNDSGHQIIGGANLSYFFSTDPNVGLIDYPGVWGAITVGSLAVGVPPKLPTQSQTIEIGYAYATAPSIFPATDGTNNNYIIGVNTGGGFWRAAADVVITSGPTADFIISGFNPDGGGIGNAALASAGMRFRVVNKTAHNLSFTHEGAGSTAANRILTPTGQTITIPVNGWAAFTYDAVSSRHRLDGTSLMPAAATGTNVLTDAATVTVNLLSGNFCTLLTTVGVGATRTVGNPTNAVVGMTYYLDVTAHASAGIDLDWDTSWEFGNGMKPHLTQTSGAKDLFSFIYNGSKFVVSLLEPDHK